MKKKNDLELAGIVKFELDKDLLLDKVMEHGYIVFNLLLESQVQVMMLLLKI